MNVADGLRAVRELLADPERWCQGSMAATRNGFTLNWWSPLARCFCILGAVFRVVPKGYRRPVVEALYRAASMPLGPWNDVPGRTHAEVLALVDLAFGALP